jgi:eukaryotic-like serine/threonine-protein kinase
MTSQRLLQIEAVYNAARDLGPAGRRAFLAEACRADEELRREVDSLLEQEHREGVLEQPAIEVAEKLLNERVRVGVGTQLGPYTVEAHLGSGGMGNVWKARDTRLNRAVAIKIPDTRFNARFEKEARAVSALNHPNICQIYDVGPDYLVLEYVDGKPLRGPLAAQETLRLAIQIAGAVEEAHGRGILHRDLKPANILVTARGTAKLLDFGLAKVTAGAESGVTDTFEGVAGTAAYMSPEQASGSPLDERSDIFSFGAVFYEVLSGERAFAGDSLGSVLSAVMRDQPRPLSCSPDLAGIVMRCLQKTPADRFRSMAEVRAALEAISLKPKDQPSVAVLPFANMSRDADDEYFSDGLADEIINLLARIPGLNVTARTSSFAFRGKEQDITRIAEVLRVRTILEGSVRRAGRRIRMTVQLIDAADGYHLWSERYDREMTDVFAMQDEIAAAVAGVLQVKLTGKPDTRPHEPDVAAYDAFLKGVYHGHNVSPEGYARAEEYLSQAIVLDPHWALPHSALGIFYMSASYFGLRPLGEAVALARAEARQALELFPGEPAAHRVLGQIAAQHDYDWKEAEEQFRRARASESFHPGVRIAYALFYLLPLGRFEEAIEEQAQAIAQDPVNPLWRSLRAGTFFFAGMYERAVAAAREAIELGDRSHIPIAVTAECHLYQGRLAEAREMAEEGFRVAPWDALTNAILARLLTDAGERDRAGELLARLSRMPSGGMMKYHLMGSEIDAALDWYEKGIEQREPFAVQVASSVQLKPLRASSRWPRLAKMMNLPEMFAAG